MNRAKQCSNCRNGFRNIPHHARLSSDVHVEEETMDGLIYLIGLIVVIMAILSFFGLR
jgi:predicted membrane channel-forming protein YqfA (hemolysin III family)